MFVFGTAVPAFAESPPTVAASGALTGSVKTAAGAPLADARVTGVGPATVSTTSDAQGAFTLVLPPGIYEISVTHGGFQPTSLNDIAVLAGGAQPLTVTLSEQSLSSLRTIGRASATARGGPSTINTGAATSTFVTAQTFADLANPQINDVLQRIPEVTVQHMGSQQDTSIIVGGLQPYETQVLIDGHPIALGQYGVWLSHFFPNYLVGGVETQSGPGNTTPFANIAVGGTVNMLTPTFTQRPTAEFTTGMDSYRSSYSNIVATGSEKKLAYVVAAGTAGSNGPYFKKQGCAVLEDPATNANSPNSSGIVQFCDDMSGSLFTRAEMLKLNYRFTPTSSFELGYVGSFGGYSPQGSAWGNALGPTTIERCMAPPNDLQCTSPQNQNLVGKNITAYSWYPGTQITNTQQLFTGQFRTSIGSNTLLVRPYLGSIQPESYDGTNEGGYASFFGPAPGASNYPGPPSLGPGVPIPGTGLAKPNGFEAPYSAGGACPIGSIYSFSQINSPKNTIVSLNGQEQCFQYPYTFYEKDKLYGSTFSLIHPFGESFLNFTYDFHGQSTFAYANAPSNVTVPFSANRFSTFSLTGDLRMVRNLAIDFGLYTTLWSVTGSQAQLDATGTPLVNSVGDPVITGLHRTVSRFDPHVALVFRPHANDSYRAAWGTSETFPFVGDVSGTAAYQPFAQSAPLYSLGIFTEKNPNLRPEYSSAFDVGADHRFRNGSVLSGDVQYTVVHDVFQQLTLAKNTTFQGQNGVLGIFLPINVARLRSELVTLKYAFAPRSGVGYSLALAADRSVLDGIPLAAYNDSPGFPVNNVQLCGNGLFTPGLATCVPYLKAYGHLSFTSKRGDYAGLGIDYEGKNNSYYQPPFAQLDLTLRHPLTPRLELQASVENLLNSNAFSALPAPNAGVPIVAATSGGQTTYPSTLLPVAPRTVRVQLRAHVGR
ncbi:MAG: hypothetical protein NVS3B28_10930 [Candidatus Velthaea sp.]